MLLNVRACVSVPKVLHVLVCHLHCGSLQCTRACTVYTVHDVQCTCVIYIIESKLLSAACVFVLVSDQLRPGSSLEQVINVEIEQLR